MNDIKKIIHSLSIEEKGAFINHLKEKNKRSDTKNIALFKLLDAGNTKNANKKLYNNENSKAYNALRKRLYDNLIEFIANREFESDSSTERIILKLVWACQNFLEKELPDIAFKILNKAENNALKNDSFHILNEIYQLKIQYAYLNTTTPLAEIINAYQQNSKKLKQEELLNLGYAYLRKELGVIHSQGEITDFQNLVKETIEKFGISFKDTFTFKSLYQIMFITNEYAHLNNNHYSVEAYMLKSYKEVLKKEELSDKNIYYHIQILYFMANVFFRNRDFKSSIFYLEKMHTLMQLRKAKYYNRFFLKYILLKSLNENYSGNHIYAIKIANEALGVSQTQNLNERSNLILCLAIFHFQIHDFKATMAIFKKFNHTDAWYEKRLGIDWCIKKNLIEILLHIELQNIEYALSRIISFKRRYSNYLQKHLAFINYLKFVERYINTPELINDSSFNKVIANAYNNEFSEFKDIFIISFYAWIKAKTLEKPLSKITLEMINNNHY